MCGRTAAISKGIPIEQIPKLLEHVRIDTTLHYAMVNRNNLKISETHFIAAYRSINDRDEQENSIEDAAESLSTFHT